MGLFGGGASAHRKLRRQADRHATKAMQLLEEGRPSEAYGHSRKAIEAVSELRSAQPDDPEHVVQLAGALYEHAAILDQLGNTVEAVAVARDALALYRDVSGRDMDPAEAAQMAGLATIQGGDRRGPNLSDPAELAVLTADVKARLALLLAKAEGPRAAAEAHRLGGEAVAMYERLAVRNSQFRADLQRVTDQYEQARRLIGEQG